MSKNPNVLSAIALAMACTLVQAQEVGEYTPEELGLPAAGAPAPAAGVQRIEIRARGDDAQRTARATLSALEPETLFAMTDGRTLRVSSLGDSLRVRYGRRGPVTLRPDGAGSFVDGDGQVSLRFDLDRHGDARTAHLTIPAVWR